MSSDQFAKILAVQLTYIKNRWTVHRERRGAIHIVGGSKKWIVSSFHSSHAKNKLNGYIGWQGKYGGKPPATASFLAGFLAFIQFPDLSFSISVNSWTCVDAFPSTLYLPQAQDKNIFG